MSESGDSGGRPAAPARGGGVIGLFVRHPNAANLLMVLMFLLGAFAVLQLNTQFLPTTEVKQVQVSIAWPGASAEDVSANILDAVEPAVRFLDGVQEVTSYAREGSAFTSVEFDETTDMQKALADVEQAIAALTTLPESAERARISTDRIRDTVAKVSVAGPFTEIALQEYARRVRDGLLDAGVDKITFTGMREREIRVEADEETLRRLGLEVDELSRAVRSGTVDRPSGTLEGEVDKQLRVLAPGETADTIAGIEVKAFPSGERILVSDVARVVDGFDEDAVVGLKNGEPAIEMQVWRSAGQDAVAVDRLVRAYVAEVAPTLPATLRVAIYDSSTEMLWERISILVKNGWQGLVVVLVILFLFLDARIAFWVAFGIPVALAGTFAIMFATGQTINMISLFALLMMLGVIVDDAIVVGEHADTLEARGLPPMEAAEGGARQMLMPVMAASITTLASFAPIFIMGGVIGQIMGALPLVAIAIIIASVIECFLILPGHLAHRWGGFAPGVSVLRFSALGLSLVTAAMLFLSLPPEGAPAALAPFLGAADAARAALGPWLFPAVVTVFALLAALPLELALAWLSRRGGTGGRGRFRRGFDRGFAAFRDGPFRRAVEASFAFRYATLAVAVGAVMVVVWGLYLSGGHVKFYFFPSPEAEFLTARVEFNAGTPRERVMEAVGTIERVIGEAEEAVAPKGERIVRNVYAVIGRAGRDRGDNLAELRVQLMPTEDRTVRTPAFVRAVRERLPEIGGVKRLALAERRGGPPGRDLDVRLTDAPPAVLKAAAADLMGSLGEYAGLSAVSDDLPYGKPELAMRLTPRGAALGFTLDDVARQVRGAFEGSIARRLPVGDDEIRVRVLQRSALAGDSQLRDMWLKTPDGGFAALSEVVEIEERNTFSFIRRRDGVLSISVTADVDTAVTTPQEVTAALSQELLPAIAARHGVDYAFGGRDEERRESFADLRQGQFLALAVIYLTLAFVFGSYARPLAVMLIIPFGAVGAILGHWLLGYNLSITSMVGLLGLTGILVNDSIILVKRMDERLAEGEALAAAACGASRDRLRAVILTSLTTIGGLVPLMFERSLQAQFLMPMAITIVFGLAVATLLVLFLVPSLVGIGGDIGRLARLLARRRPAPAAAE